MRPLWERTLTWGVADHLRRCGLDENAAYNVAALVVRDLDRRNNLMAAMASYVLTAPGDVDDPEKTSPRFLEATGRFWSAVASSSLEVERNRLLMIAVSSLLSSGPEEQAAAAALARDARTIESVKGRIGGEWRGLAGLRDEIASRAGADVLESYDALVRSASIRKTYVKEYQTWAKARGWYTGRIDGIWGPRTEDAMVRTISTMSGRYSGLGDALQLQRLVGFPLARALGVLIARDLWLDQHPERLIPATDAETAAETESSTGLPSGDLPGIVVTYPKEEGASTPRITTTDRSSVESTSRGPLPTDQTATIREVKSAGWRPSRNAIVGAGLVACGALIAGGAWWASRRRRAREVAT